MYRQLNYKGSVFQYECTGNGPAVVLLHGFGEDASVWGFQKEHLEKHFQILMPDLPGSGRSQTIADMSMEGLADAVHYLLQEEGIEKCAMIGHSMGGYIALAFAERYGGMLNGLGLFHSSALADSDEKMAMRKKGIAFMREQGAYSFLKTSIPNLYSPATKENTPALIKQQLQAAHGFSKEALIRYYEAMIARPDRTGVLRHTEVPVLFVLGRWDTAVPLQDGLAQCHIPQLAYIHVLDRSGHMGMLEEPEGSNALLTSFLSETVALV
jgi:pimeloyl-ACP methyl ester carboxylesterase